MKQIVSATIAFVAGLGVAMLVWRGDTRKPSLTSHNEVLSVASAAAVDEARIRAGYERQIAELKIQLEMLRNQVATLDGTTRPANVQEQKQQLLEKMRLEGAQDSVDRARARAEVAEKQETDLLLAAGYTLERIQWIRKRSKELAAESLRKADLLRQQGKPDLNAELARRFDSDLDLRYELGDEEYARYRQAMGRSLGMQVEEVTPGGTGEGAGLKVGDEIIRYNGVRVFNAGEVGGLVNKYLAPGATVAVDVMRNGQVVRLNMRAGDFRARAPVPSLSVRDRANAVEALIKTRPKELDLQDR